METKVVTGTRGGKVVDRHARNWSSGFQERKKRGNGRNGVGRGGICVSFVKTVGISFNNLRAGKRSRGQVCSSISLILIHDP